MKDEWRASGSSFEGDRWRAEFVRLDHDGVEQPPPYVVELSHGETPEADESGDILARSEIPLAGERAVLLHRFVPTFTAAAVEPGQSEEHALELRAGRGLFIRRAFPAPPSAEARDEMCRLAERLLTAEGPLAPASEEILLVTTSGCGTDPNALRLCARVGDTIEIRMRLRYRVTIPLRGRIDRREGPLPGHAFAILSHDRGGWHVPGRPTSDAGEIRFGPFRVESPRRMRFEVALPLAPPGTWPELVGTVLLRSGRPVEEWLDAGEPPETPPPAGIKPQDLAAEVARQAALAVNPDFGSAGGLMPEDLVDLYAIANAEVDRHEDLRALTMEALHPRMEDPIYCDRPPALSSGSGWSHQDACAARSHPRLATQLAEKLLASLEPLGRRATKVEMEERPDPEWALPHAVAAQACALGLGSSGPGQNVTKLREALARQLEHFESRHLGQVLQGPLWDLLEIAEDLRGVAEGPWRRLSQALFDRFVRGEKMGLREKLRIARMFAKREPLPAPTGRPADERPPDTDRLRYACALGRIAEETDRGRREEILRQWRDYFVPRLEGDEREKFLKEWEARRATLAGPA